MNGKSGLCDFCKVICKFKAIPIPITEGLSPKSEFILTFMWKGKKRKKITKTLKPEQGRGPDLSDSKTL